MTVSSITNKWSYTLDGSTVDYPYTTRVFASSDLAVEVYVISSGSLSSTLAETTDYTVSGVGEADGGNVSLVAPETWDNTYSLVIRRRLPLTQTVDPVENDPNRAETTEEAYDRAVMIAQQQQEELDRCVKVSAGSSSTPDELIDDLNTAVAGAESAKADAETARDEAETAQGLAETAQVAAELAAQNFEFASQAEAEAGVNETKSMNPLRTAQAIAELASGGSVNVENGTSSWIMSNTGAQAITGLGFQPKLVGIFATKSGATMVSNSVTATAVAGNASGYWRNSSTGVWGPSPRIVILSEGTNRLDGDITSFDSDGFTITWAHQAGSPSGTAYVYWWAIG